MENEQQIFDILDGIASREAILQHKNFLKTSPEYLANFKELEALHIGLAGMKLEQPSTNFTNNLLENLGIVVVKKRSWTTKPAYIFAGIMFVMVVISAIFFPVGALILANRTDQQALGHGGELNRGEIFQTGDVRP